MPGLNVSTNSEARGAISAASLVLFRFGERAAVVEATKQASVIANIAFNATHQQIIYDVSVAFYANAAARARCNGGAIAQERASGGSSGQRSLQAFNWNGG